MISYTGKPYLKSAFVVLLSTTVGMSCLHAQTVREKVMTRIFWQDRETDKLSYADLVKTNKWSIKRNWVKGFPELDAEKQHLAQMKECVCWEFAITTTANTKVVGSRSTPGCLKSRTAITRTGSTLASPRSK